CGLTRVVLEPAVCLSGVKRESIVEARSGYLPTFAGVTGYSVLPWLSERAASPRSPCRGSRPSRRVCWLTRIASPRACKGCFSSQRFFRRRHRSRKRERRRTSVLLGSTLLLCRTRRRRKHRSRFQEAS